MIRIEIDGRGVLVRGPLEGLAREFEDELVRRGFRRNSNVTMRPRRMTRG